MRDYIVTSFRRGRHPDRRGHGKWWRWVWWMVVFKGEDYREKKHKDSHEIAP